MTEIMRTSHNENTAIQAHSAASMVQAIMASGITAENAAAMKDVVELYRVMRADEAKASFGQAFARLQGEIPRIAAIRVIPNNDGTARSTFAALEDIQDAIAPFLERNGFSISFDSTTDDKFVMAKCILTHDSGHSETRSCAVHISAPPKSSPAQADGATLTYAKRQALCNMFNIQINKDTDARIEGDFISEDQAASLERRLAATGRDRVRFLKLAHADDFRKIRTGRYAMLDGALLNAEKLNPTAPPTGQVPTSAPIEPTGGAPSSRVSTSRQDAASRGPHLAGK